MSDVNLNRDAMLLKNFFGDALPTRTLKEFGVDSMDEFFNKYDTRYCITVISLFEKDSIKILKEFGFNSIKEFIDKYGVNAVDGKLNELERAKYIEDNCMENDELKNILKEIFELQDSLDKKKSENSKNLSKFNSSYGIDSDWRMEELLTIDDIKNYDEIKKFNEEIERYKNYQANEENSKNKLLFFQFKKRKKSSEILLNYSKKIEEFTLSKSKREKELKKYIEELRILNKKSDEDVNKILDSIKIKEHQRDCLKEMLILEEERRRLIEEERQRELSKLEEERRKLEEERQRELSKLEELELIEAATQGGSKEKYDLSIWYYNEKILEEYFYWLEQSAEHGNIIAQQTLGLTYLKGKDNTEKDVNKAVEWLEKAAEQGDSESQFELAQLYCYGDNNFQADIGKGLDLLKMIGEDEKRSLFLLLRLHIDGIIQKDPVDLFEFYENIFNDYKEPLAMIALGELYCTGKGKLITIRNPIKGANYIEEGIKHDKGNLSPDFYFRIGNLFYEGKTTADGKCDLEKSLKYFEKAAVNGTEKIKTFAKGLQNNYKNAQRKAELQIMNAQFKAELQIKIDNLLKQHSELKNDYNRRYEESYNFYHMGWTARVAVDKAYKAVEYLNNDIKKLEVEIEIARQELKGL